MELQKQQPNLYASLPQTVQRCPNLKLKDDQTEQVTALLKEKLPASEQQTIKQELNWHFPLEKQQKATTKQKRKRKHRKNRLAGRSLKPGEVAHEVEAPVGGWSYQALLPVRDMWREYIKRCIGKPVENGSLQLILGKCEFIGAEVTVEKSTVTNMVGLSGIVVRETQRLFEIVDKKSEYKKIQKTSTVLTFNVGILEFTVIGKHFMTRPAERSVKKIKSIMFADL